MRELPLSHKIRYARNLSERHRKEAFRPFRSVGELLKTRAEETPEKILMIWYSSDGSRGEMTYSEFLRRVRNRVRVFVDRGLTPGDRVAAFSGNFPETASTYFACWHYGLTVVPLNVREDPAHLRFILRNSQVNLIVTRPELENSLADLLRDSTDLQGTAVIAEPVEIDAGDADDVDRRMSSVEPTTEALIVYTSGTTGNPKGVVLDQYNLLVDGHALAEWHKITPDSRMMCVLPIHHVNGTVVTMVTPLVAGSSFVLNERFSVHNFFPRIVEEDVAVVSVVPTLLAFLLEADIEFDGLRRGRLHHIICGAGPLTVDLAMRFEDKFRIPIAHGYGLSETTCYSCCLPVDLPGKQRRKWLSRFGYPSIGVPFPVNEMEIHNPDGKPLGADLRGEIVIRGHNVMSGYFGNEEANRNAFTHGWFRSGDEGFWLPDTEGESYFFITGRLKEIILRGGVNISPFEIDEVLMSIPGVRAGIAVGFPHDLYGEEVGAYIEPEESGNLTDTDVIAACRRQLPFFKSPKIVLFGRNMPVTSTGKYQRNKLKGLFERWRHARFKE